MYNIKIRPQSLHNCYELIFDYQIQYSGFIYTQLCTQPLECRGITIARVFSFKDNREMRSIWIWGQPSNFEYAYIIPDSHLKRANADSRFSAIRIFIRSS